MERAIINFCAAAFLVTTSFAVHPVLAADAKPASWDNVVAEAKKEGKLIVGIPPSTELRKQIEPLLSRVMLQSTRRVDVDTKWMVKEGVEPAKDFLTLKDYDQQRNYLEDKCVGIRLPSQKLAEAILQ